MNKDKHLERRKMIISKYSNRPPFDLKKPRNFHDIVEKIKSYPEETCENCCRKRITFSTSENLPKPSNKFMNNTSENNLLESKLKNKKVISKVIQQFQDVTPTRVVEEQQMSQNTSVQTIYRKSNHCKLGKNLPKHNLMKSLLQNLDSEIPAESKGVNMKTTIRSSCKEKKGETNNICSCKKPPKLNKKTSTTGLPWPPKHSEILHYRPSNCTNSKQVSSCNCSKNLKTSKESFKSKLSDEIPTRDVPTEKSVDRKTREKTFVQAQVDKLNKVWKPTKIPGHYQSPVQRPRNSKTVTVNLRQQKESGYIEMMNKIRNNCRCPDFILSVLYRQFDTSSASNVKGYDSTTSWSNGSETGLLPEDIQFPRETRTAVDQRLREETQRQRTRIPLSKFTTKSHNIYKPALPHVFDNQLENSNGDAGYSNQCSRSTNQKLTRPTSSKVKLPCKKNLLCQKADQHMGGCVYAKKNNKVQY